MTEWCDTKGESPRRSTPSPAAAEQAKRASSIVALPDDTAEKAKGWAEKEGEKAKVMESLAAFNKDPIGALQKRR